MHAEEHIDSIYLELINGDTEISKEKVQFDSEGDGNGGGKGGSFEDMLRIKMVRQAEKQRLNLEHKLSYLTNSINALNNY